MFIGDFVTYITDISLQ